jgi:hypothetical protein
MRNYFVAAALVAAGLSMYCAPARAVLSNQDGKALQEAVVVDGVPLQARLYHLPGSRVLGQVSMHQGVTVWEITAGSWNGQSLQGLALVLVDNPMDVSQSRTASRCFVSHTATPAQREALLDAYLTSQSLPADDGHSCRVEPAVIRLERIGSMVFVHLGLVA